MDNLGVISTLFLKTKKFQRLGYGLNGTRLWLGSQPSIRDRRTVLFGLMKVSNMTKTPANSGKVWTTQSNAQLKSLAKGNTPTRIIALDMKRTPASVQSQAGKLGVSLKPTNQSPYGTKK